MSDFETGIDDGEELLAAEYALGVLDLETLRLAERRRRTDPVFAAEVARWEERLGPLASAVEPVSVPPHLWPAIEQDLNRLTRWKPASAEPAREGLGLRFWRWLSFGSLAVAAASLAALVLVAGPLQPAPGSQPAPAMHAASLTGEGGSPLFTAVIDAGAASATLIPIGPAAEAGARELWLIPAGGTPRSLGLLDPAAPKRLQLPEDFLQAAGGGASLAVSLEPEGGSPTGLPTGPVVAQGAIQSI